jgi:choline monooxygenase
MASVVLGEEELGRVAADIDRGYTLPARWYADPAFLEIERERIFARSWQYVGRAAQVAEPGDYFVGRAGHIPVVVVRGEDGTLRGLVNVCRHRGHEVASGEGNRKTLQCPYHAWTYGLDGCLRRAPRSETAPGFDRDELGLLPVQVDTWGPFVFVNPDPGALPLADTLGELSEIVARSGLDVGALQFRERRQWTLTANWKVGLENYLECYHCPVAHPGFSALLDVAEDAYVISPQGAVSSQIAQVRPAVLNGNGKAAYDPQGEVKEAQYHFVWPNATINIEAGRPNLSIDVWIPDGPDRALGISDQFFGPDVPVELQDEMMAFSRQVGREDDSLVESVQRGLSSGMVERGRLLLPSEGLIAHFQRLVFDAVAG